MSKISPLTGRYVVSTIINHSTRQVFITFNDSGLPNSQKGLHRIMNRFVDLHDRILRDARDEEEFKTVYLRQFHEGMMWALFNTRDSLKDWGEERLEGDFSKEECISFEKEITAKWVEQGYTNVRIKFFFGKRGNLGNLSSWGKCDLNKPQKKFIEMMNRIGKAINKDIPLHVATHAHYLATKRIPEILNKLDLYYYLVEVGVLE